MKLTNSEALKLMSLVSQHLDYLHRIKAAPKKVQSVQSLLGKLIDEVKRQGAAKVPELDSSDE